MKSFCMHFAVVPCSYEEKHAALGEAVILRKNRLFGKMLKSDFFFSQIVAWPLLQVESWSL